jgi:PIN domain nuclease of toxin-antitoxin system
MIYVLDTHAIVWAIENDPRLSAAAKAVLKNPTSELVVPTMVLVEVRYLTVKKRFSANLAQVYQQFINATNCRVHPLDEEVVARIPTGLDIHDAIITATALVYRDLFQQPVALITKDIKITQSGLIQTLW